jgi:hypothetical protein
MEENVQYLNYLLGKETWKGVFKQNSVNEAYNLFLYTLRYYYDIAMPKKHVQIKSKENKWIRVSGNRLRLLNILNKEGHMSQETKKYYCHYNRIYNKFIREARKLTNTMRIRASENKTKAMWDLIKEELGTQAKTLKNIEINMNGTNIRDQETIANVFNELNCWVMHPVARVSPIL